MPIVSVYHSLTLIPHELSSSLRFPPPCQLVEFHLAVANDADRELAVLTTDVWLVFQDTELSERHPDMQQPLYAQVLRSLVMQCSHQEPEDYPADAVASPLDEEEYGAFRVSSSSIKDVFVSTFYILGSQYFQELVSMLQDGPGWQVRACAHYTFVQHVSLSLRVCTSCCVLYTMAVSLCVSVLLW